MFSSSGGYGKMLKIKRSGAMDQRHIDHVRISQLTDRMGRGVGVDGGSAETIDCAFTVTGVGSLTESTLR